MDPVLPEEIDEIEPESRDEQRKLRRQARIIPKLPLDEPDEPPRLRRQARVIQRLPFGSPFTNTLNLPPPPPPCYVHHLLIHEEWVKDNSKPPADKKPKRDPVDIAKDIKKQYKALEDAGFRLDNAVLDPRPDYYAIQSRKIKAEILTIQDKILKLDMERIASQADLAPFKPPSGIREFVIVEYIPPQIGDYITQAENKLKPLRIKLTKAYNEWYEAHTEHEAVKKELKGFAKKKQILADARDKARTEYELARRLQSASQANAQLKEKALAIKKAFKLDAQSKLKRAEKGEVASKAEFIEAQAKYRDFAFYAYGRINTREKDLYKKLVTKLKEVKDITTQIGVIEAEAQEAKNTLVSGSTIQMTSYETGLDFGTRSYWSKKVPNVSLQLNGETTLFPAQDTFCQDNPPQFNDTHLDPISKKNVSHRHPHLQVIEPESKLNQHYTTATPPTGFKIYEIHRMIFTPTKTIVGAIVGFALSGIVAVFQHIFSFFPKKRYYKILAETCGFMASGMKVPDKLEATLEVFPADVYTITIKTQPGFGYTDIMRSEQLADTTKIQGEVAYSDAENAASPVDHTVSSSESFSVFGVTQSSTTTSVTKSEAFINSDGDVVDAREITTVTTLTRDGIFGSATITDVSTGTFDGGETAYSSTMVREQTLGSPLTDATKLTSLQQSYTDKDGVVTDASKVVDSQGIATALDEDGSGSDAGTMSGRPPSVPPTYMPQIPVDLILSRNGVEDPVTEDLRRTLGMIIYLVKKTADMIGRIGNMMPSVGWHYGFTMTFLTGALSYTHDHREHTDKRVWLHHKFDLDLNLITAKVFVFGGATIETILLLVQVGLEVYVKGLIGIKGNFENSHPDADNKFEIGFGPTGGIGIGAEIRAIVGQPDWVSATGTIESGINVEAIYWAKKNGESAPFLDVSFKWEGVKLKGVVHIILVGHWEKEIPIFDEKEIWSGRFPKMQKEEEIKQMLDAQTEELEESYNQRRKEAAKREKKLQAQKVKLAKIKK